MTQRSTEGLSRHPLIGKKSLSQGDSIEDVEGLYDLPRTKPSPAPRQKHLYETIKPKLIYVDVDLSHRREV